MIRLALAAIFSWLLPLSASAGVVSLAWDANPEPNVAGYFLSYGTSSGQYSGRVDVGNVTTYQFTEPDPYVRYYIAVQAYTTEGLISGFSNEVVTTPAPPLTVTTLSANRLSPQTVGTGVTFAAAATGGTTPYQYKWWIINGATATVAQNWSATNVFTWTPSAAGSSYVIRVWARSAGRTADAPDNSSAVLDMSFVVTAPNQPPVVSAGNDLAITLPGSASLMGTASDDGLPAPPGTVTVSWSQVSGPGTVTFAANTLNTSASFSTAGTYVLRLMASDGALTASDDVTVVVTAATTSGTGLTAQYFNDDAAGTAFTRLAASRIDATVNFDWGWTAPAASVQPDNFSVRWTGQVQAPVSGPYTFSTITDDGVRLWVNGQLVIDDWRGHAPTRNVSPVLMLTAGVRYDLRLEYYEGSAGATAQLLWTPPGQPEVVMPTSQLFPATYSPIPPSNQPPVVSAGNDLAITLPGSASLMGTASDDGLPAPPGTVTVSWSQVSGPGTVTFAANTLNTSASFSTAGTYVLRLMASDGALTASDDVTVVVTAATTSGTGLTAQYFNDDAAGTAFTRLAASRIDATVNFDWGWTAPAASVQPDNFSVRWTGQVQAPISGPYTFSTITDDGVRLWVNGQLMIDDWRGHAPTRNVSPVLMLTAGVRYDLRLEYYEGSAGATAQLLWTPPGQAEAVIPTTQLFPPSGGNMSPPPGQAGLIAEYFNDQGPGASFAALAASRIDSTVNFDWGWTSPLDNVQTDHFSARWRGKILAPTSGSYRFATIGDDGVRLWVNGQLVIDDWQSHPPTRNVSAMLTLVGGATYDIRLEYYEATGGATVTMLWTPPGGSEQVVPATQFSH